MFCCINQYKLSNRKIGWGKSHQNLTVTQAASINGCHNWLTRKQNIEKSGSMCRIAVRSIGVNFITDRVVKKSVSIF
jgi:hypothetical protein